MLAFDKDNKLVAVTRDAINEDSIADSKLFLRKMIDFQKNPPVVIHSGAKGDDKDGVKGADAHLEYMLASTRQPITVVNGEVRRSSILYCDDERTLEG